MLGPPARNGKSPKETLVATCGFRKDQQSRCQRAACRSAPAPAAQLKQRGAGETRSVRIDLTEQFKGHYGWQIGFDWQGSDGIDALEFATTTQVSQSIYPRLAAGGSDVHYHAASRAVVPVLPNFSLPEERIEAVEEVSMRSSNLQYNGLSESSRLAYQTTNNQRASVVFRIESPRPLQEVRAAFQYGIRSPSPKNADFSLEISTDSGNTWQEMARAEIAEDNEFSSGWLAGAADVSDQRATSALVRVGLYAGGYQTGLLQAQFYGVYGTEPPGPVELSLGWKEGEEPKNWQTQLEAGVKQRSFEVPTGEQVTDQFISLRTL